MNQTNKPSHIGHQLLMICALGFVFNFHSPKTGQAQSFWPSFRNNGTSLTRVKTVPTEWAPNKNVIWRTDIPGYGQSSPIVWNQKIFLTSSEGPFQEKGFVHCYDLSTGSKRWTTTVQTSTKIENYFRNSRAAPSCVVDKNVVISFFASGDVTAMTHDGKIIWSVPLFKRFGEASNERGTASSLVQSNDLVFALVDHDGPSYIVALKKDNGEVAWKADRGKRMPSWSSPIVVDWKGVQMVVASSADTVDAYDTSSGKHLWELKGLSGNHIPSASFVDGSIYVGSTRMIHSESNPEKVAASNCRIDLHSKDGQPSFKIRWGAKQANSYYSSPLCFDDYVYYVNKSGVLFCIDRESGERLYANRIGNPCWSSAVGVLTAEGKKFVYFFTKKGRTIVIRPGKTFDLVSRNQLWDIDEMKANADAAAIQRRKNQVPAEQAKPKTGPEKFLSGLPEKSLHKMFSYGDPIVYAGIVVEGNILIRTGQHLYCVRDKSGAKQERTPLRDKEQMPIRNKE